MKFSKLIFLFMCLAQMSYSQNFITQWTFASTTTEIQFNALTTDTVHYTWTASPSGNNGNGHFIKTTPGKVTLKGLSIEAHDKVTISMAPDNLSRFYFDLNIQDNRSLIDVSQWGGVSWTSMSKAFIGCHIVRISASDTPNLNHVTTMDSMFYDATYFNEDIGHWDVSNVTDMRGMFNRTRIFNQNISSWDVSNVTHMNHMFTYAPRFNQDISSWDVSSVTDMSSMFYGTRAFNQDIGGWDVSNVTDMNRMFVFASNFNQDIGEWDVSNVTDMRSMFLAADSFNQDIGSWNVWNVTNMISMFNRAISYNQNIGSWKLHPLVEMVFMFNNSAMDCDHYSATLIGWQQNNPSVTEVTLGAAGLQYGTSAIAARDSLINVQGWTIMGDEASDKACDELVSTAFVPSSERNPLVIYPNPTSGQITVKDSQFEFENLRVINSLGRELTGEVIIRQQSGSSANVDLSGLPAGTYFLQTARGSGVVYKE